MDEATEVMNGNVEPVESPSTEKAELARSMSSDDYVHAIEKAAAKRNRKDR